MKNKKGVLADSYPSRIFDGYQVLNDRNCLVLCPKLSMNVVTGSKNKETTSSLFFLAVKGKGRVKRKELNNPDKMKYYIYDAIKTTLPDCKNEKDLQLLLQKAGIETEFKLKRTAVEVEGISLQYDNIVFKGSQIDRKFSYGNLKKSLRRILNYYSNKKRGIKNNRKISTLYVE